MTSVVDQGGLKRLEHDGFVSVTSVLSTCEVDALLERLDDDKGFALRARDGAVFAVRNALDVSAVSEIARSHTVRALIDSVLGSSSVAVRATLFDKVAGANWKVPFHQDLTIEVQERREQPGFAPWSIKGGVHCVQAPDAILRSMVAFRLHLDDTPTENGPLRVLPGSHAHGRLSPSKIEQIRATTVEVQCLAAKGDALLIRPLLLHASSAATRVKHRRVLHIDFGPETLPGDLEWHRSV